MSRDKFAGQIRILVAGNINNENLPTSDLSAGYESYMYRIAITPKCRISLSEDALDLLIEKLKSVRERLAEYRNSKDKDFLAQE